MEKLYIVIAEASLELVPEEILGERDIISSAKRRGVPPERMLLDISYHYHSMRRLSNWFKRGRPDLIHTTLLVIGSSIIWRRDLARVVIETRHGLVIVREGVRIVRHFNRFVSLMEQVLTEGKAPPNSDQPLIYLLKRDLIDFIRELNPDLGVIMHEKGSRVRIRDLGRMILSARRPLIIVGGFQRGDFSERILKLEYPKISISEENLDTWAVLCKILSFVDEALEDYSPRK
ncbi:MAG: hypothetical protein QW713_05285 [Sulfolobales archaeon]